MQFALFFFIIQLLQKVGEGDSNPGSPHKGNQAMPLSYKALGHVGCNLFIIK